MFEVAWGNERAVETCQVSARISVRPYPIGASLQTSLHKPKSQKARRLRTRTLLQAGCP